MSLGCLERSFPPPQLQQALVAVFPLYSTYLYLLQKLSVLLAMFISAHPIKESVSKNQLGSSIHCEGLEDGAEVGIKLADGSEDTLGVDVTSMEGIELLELPPSQIQLHNNGVSFQYL